jgi:undecaprenyl-diphosphatase
MQILEAIILGLVQGLTEFLPISSSAHLRIVGEFLPGAQDPGAAFTAITQIGTEAAVVVFFWRDIVRIIGRWFRSLSGAVPRRDPDALMGWYIIVGSVPIVVLGVAFQDQIETTFRSLWLVATMLIVFGVLLGVADILGRRTRTLENLTWGRAIVFDRTSAARYAFLLAIPAVFGSGFYQLVKHGGDEGAYGLLETGIATVVAFGVGLAVIAFLMRYISKRSFLPFVIYRVLLGVAVMILLATGVVQAG